MDSSALPRERRPSTTPTSQLQQLKTNNFELQIEIRKKSSRNLNDKNETKLSVTDQLAADVDVVEKLDIDTQCLVTPADNKNNIVVSSELDIEVPGFDRQCGLDNAEKLEKEPSELIMDSFYLKKKTYFDKHNISNEYDKITNYDESDTLFEIKTKQTLIKTFKFNANSKAHIKNMKFKYSEVACQNNSYLQQAKMAFYDTLLNKGGNNLNNKYLKSLNSARFTSKSSSKFDTETSNALNNFYTNTADNLSHPIETYRSVTNNNNNKLPGLKGQYSGNTNNQNTIMDKIRHTRKSKDNLMVTNNKPTTDASKEDEFTQRGEASEYYNNKIRLIAKLIEKHNARLEDNKDMKKKYDTLPSAASKKSKKNKNFIDENQNSSNSHFIASFPSQPGSNNVHVLNGLNPFKTTKLDRQFKRVIHIDHNKRFNSKSSSQMGDNHSQVNGEKPIDSSRNVNLLKDRSFVKLSGFLNKKQQQNMPSNSSVHKNSSNLVKIKFPSINNNSNINNNDFENFDKDNSNIFASSSFVKSESAYKDTIKS